jgi:hypothetical protein
VTRDERAAARKRCEAASKSPWVQHDLWLAWLRWLYTQAKRRYTRDAVRIYADFDFIVAARTDLPAALDALDAADERIAELEAEVARLENALDESLQEHP